MEIHFITLYVPTQNSNYITRNNFAACMNYSTCTVFSGQRLKTPFPFYILVHFWSTPYPFTVYILFEWPHSSHWFHSWLWYIVIVWLKLSFSKSKELTMLKILWITLQFCLFEVTTNILYSLALCFSIFWKFSLYNNMEEILLATVKKVSFTD